MTRIYIQVLLLAIAIGCDSQDVFAKSDVKVKYRDEISQYGITWTFDKPAKTGQFITGDWWVIGPVRIVTITPSPGPATNDNTFITRNHWGDTSLEIDTTMRNGSMIILRAGKTQGYDSRNASYDSTNSIKLPLDLIPNRSLISSISNDTLPVDNFCKNIMWDSEKMSRVTLKTASV